MPKEKTKLYNIRIPLELSKKIEVIVEETATPRAEVISFILNKGYESYMKEKWGNV